MQISDIRNIVTRGTQILKTAKYHNEKKNYDDEGDKING
jgi:hypothetical protein